MPIKKLIALICALIFIISPLPGVPPVFSENLDVSSGNLDKITKELADMQDAFSKSVAATKPLQSELDRMKKQIQGIKNQVASIEYDMQIKKKEINNGYKNLAHKQEIVLRTIRDFYIKSYTESPLTIFLSQAQSSEKTQEEIYQDIKTKQDRNIITNLALSITDLEKKKIQLEKDQKWLITTKANLDEQSAKLDEVVQGALAYQKDVSAKIEELSALQQAIINARSGNFTFSIGDGELADEYLSSIKGFRETAPSGYFAVFSFGAYTHRNGMSQYGARARAEAGQNYQNILSKYYPGSNLETKGDFPGDINVEGYGNMSFEDRYLMGIAEMPSNWHLEALKAQAITARTYAYNQTRVGYTCGKGGRPGIGVNISTDEYCQAYLDSKASNPPQAWKDAVQSTRGQILTKDGQPISTQYASTHGGFTNQIGWDTTDETGGGNFIDKSYEKLGGSPWLYKAWWRDHYSNSGATCGRSNPWLSPEEMADIVNTVIALRTSGIDTLRITPTTTSCWNGNPYSIDELRTIVTGHGGINSATNVSVSQGNGMTNTVTINGIGMSGEEFKKAFALRAPGYLRIPQSGFAFFNIEQK